MSDEKEPGADLIDRWMTHRQQTAGERVTPPLRGPDPWAPDPSLEEPAETSGEEPIEEPAADPLFDATFMPEPADPAPLFDAIGPDQAQLPIDFQPVITPSARKKALEPRLGRRRTRHTRRAEAPAEKEAERAAVDAEQAQEAEVRRRAEAEARREAEARIAAQLGEAGVAEVRRSSTPQPSGTPAPIVREPEEHEPRGRPARAAGPSLDQPDAAHAFPTTSERAQPNRPAPPNRPAQPAPAADGSGNIVFPPRTGLRRLAGLVLLLVLAAAAVAAYVAYDRPTTFAVGIAVTLGVLALVVWAVRAGSTTARLTVVAGQLEVVTGDGRFVFDLKSSYTPIEVDGEPGVRGWRVLFHRRGMAPFVIDSTMVDPAEFMRVLRHHRPDADRS